VKEGKIDVATAAKVAKLPAKERKKAAKEALAAEAVAVAHEEQTAEKEADLAAEFVGAVEAVALWTEHFETEFTKSQ
jgi:ribosomal protein L4